MIKKVMLNLISKKKFLLLFALSFCANNLLFPTHNTSRYLPFLERPEDYVIRKRSHITPAFFFTRASSANKRGGGDCGIPELWGKYNLRDVIASLEKVYGDDFVNPIISERGPNDSWVDKSIKYKVEGKVKTRGFMLNYEQYIKPIDLSVGAFIPLMHVNTSDRFILLKEKSSLGPLRPGEVSQLDRIQRATNKDLGVHGGDWNTTGFGDLDLHLRYNYDWDHVLLMKGIDVGAQAGVVVPTGRKADINYPSSVPFMGNGFWGLYLDFIAEFELKQDWKFGLLFGGIYQFENKRKLRVPVYKEPAIFSALITNIDVDPGMTFKISPYIYADNLADGLNIHARYTYLRHEADTWHDPRKDPEVRSYLNQEVGAEFYGNRLTKEDILKNISRKKNLSRWSANYITVQIAYDTKDGGNKWWLDPTIYAVLDYNFSGNAFTKTLQLTFGIELHF